MRSECRELTSISAAHTTPLRLSAVSGERMKEFADFAIQKWQDKRRVAYRRIDFGASESKVDNTQFKIQFKIQYGPMSR